MKSTCLYPPYFYKFMLHWCLASCLVVISACGGGGGTDNTPQGASVTIKLANVNQLAGSSVDMPVTLNTTTDVTAVQFDIDYDSAGISLDPTSVATALSNGHQVYASAISENRIRIVIAPTAGLSSITDGDSLLLPLLLSNTATGAYTLKVSNVVTAEAGKQDAGSFNIVDGTVNVQ